MQLGMQKNVAQNQLPIWKLKTAGDLETDFAIQEIVPINGPKQPAWYEWLVRPRGMGADELIDAVQSLDWMVDFDLAVIRNACRWLQLQNHRSVPCRLSVNVFADSISCPEFADQVIDTICNYQVSAEQLCFEIVEHTPVYDLHAATHFCRTIRNIGAQIALDDIGSGHVHVGLIAPESLVDYLKIDRTAVVAARQSERQFKAVQSVIEFAKSVNVPVVLEGIETAEDLDLTERFGAAYYQGYFHEKPHIVDWGVCEERTRVAYELRELTA